MAEQLSIDRGKTAVLIMDYQNRQLSSFPEEFQKEILRKANEVLARARRAGIPVIYVEVVRGDRTPEVAIHPAITPKAGELVLTKSRTGPFSTTNLDEVLKKQKAETLVLLGISTSGCVLTTVRCAADMDYKLVVLSDCCADRDDEVHRVLMEKLFPRQASVITSQQFFLALGKA
ncbi:MAG: isochorismatase hydrolase family protein [Dehalococcoidales bacterium]|nr:isochorismatase hydrolase family protein [Dehalococcoidales bacterium]